MLMPCGRVGYIKMRAASFPSLLSQLIEGESSDDEAFSAIPFNSPFAISGGRDRQRGFELVFNVSCSNSFVCPPIVVVVIVIQSPLL
jgi:hypothetical protein